MRFHFISVICVSGTLLTGCGGGTNEEKRSEQDANHADSVDGETEQKPIADLSPEQPKVVLPKKSDSTLDNRRSRGLIKLCNLMTNSEEKVSSFGYAGSFPLYIVDRVPLSSQTSSPPHWTSKKSINGNCVRIEGQFFHTSEDSANELPVYVTGIFMKQISSCKEWNSESQDLMGIERFGSEYETFQKDCSDFHCVGNKFVEIIKKGFKSVSEDEGWNRPEYGFVFLSEAPLE